MKSNRVTPFLKWAGGKRWLTNEIPKIIPSSFNNYIEPFLGSGAIYFSLSPQKAILSDINKPLINSYQAIQENHQAVYERLKEHSLNHNQEYFYKLRGEVFTDEFDQAARFIYLNRTCFNGIYRVNQKGQFNVPKGSKDKVLLETDDFEQIAKTLKSTELLNEDFESVISRAKDGDLLYVDPPYTVKHNNNGFVKYNEKMFTWQDQERLCKALYAANDRGAHIIVSNADHYSIRDLYKENCEILSFQRNSVIASDSQNRGLYSEVLIKFE